VNIITGISGSAKGGEFIDRLSDYQLFKKDPLHGISQSVSHSFSFQYVMMYSEISIRTEGTK
jgi:hypothetical protein